MLKSILVGLDGTAHSRAAVELGFQWAKRFNALLVGIGILDKPDICRPEPVPLGAESYKQVADTARLQRARDQIERFLEDFGMRSMDAGVTAKLLEEEGLPYEQILLDAQRYDLILLGQHTHFQFATQDSDDDTLQRVLRATPRPVVVAPQEQSDQNAVIIAYDGSVQAARTLQSFESTGLAQGRPIHVVSIAKRDEDARRYIECAAEFLDYHGIAVVRHPIATAAAPAAAIIDQIKRLEAGLVVMGAYGQTTTREFFMGSVTRTMLREAKVPLFLHH